MIELAGMLEHCDFVEQAHVATEDGALRPDVVVRLPGGKSLVIDAKTPMDRVPRGGRGADGSGTAREAA
ncbi:MAG: DNA recombination protein RmuC [Verrucomicrobiota bacterium]